MNYPKGIKKTNNINPVTKETSYKNRGMTLEVMNIIEK